MAAKRDMGNDPIRPEDGEGLERLYAGWEFDTVRDELAKRNDRICHQLANKLEPLADSATWIGRARSPKGFWRCLWISGEGLKWIASSFFISEDDCMRLFDAMPDPSLSRTEIFYGCEILSLGIEECAVIPDHHEVSPVQRRASIVYAACRWQDVEIEEV